MAVEFHEASYEPTRQVTRVPMLAGLVIKMGLAKDERSANTILVGVIVLCLAIIVGVWVGNAMGGQKIEPPIEPSARNTLQMYGFA